MTAQELINAIAPLRNGLRSQDVLIYNAKNGDQYEPVHVYEEDGFICIDVERSELQV